MSHLSPQLIKSLKKAFEPVLTDVRIDWYLPENMEAFLSPNEIPPLYPGNSLIGYCTLYDMTNFKAKKTEVCITTFFKSMSVCMSDNSSHLILLFSSLQGRIIKVYNAAPQVLFLANQTMSFPLLLPLS